MSLQRYMPLIAVSALILTSKASANNISYSTSISATAASNQSPIESFSATFPQFDSSLGTLTGATITFNIPNLSAFVTVQSGTSDIFGQPTVFHPSEPYSETVSGNIVIVDPNSTDITSSPIFAYGQLPVVAVPFPTTPYSGISPADMSVVTIGTVTVPTVNYSYSANSAQFSQISGSGSFTVPFQIRTDYVGEASSGAPTVGISLSSFTGSETITYSFTPNAVPEPASLAVLGTGAALFLRRRK